MRPEKLLLALVRGSIPPTPTSPAETLNYWDCKSKSLGPHPKQKGKRGKARSGLEEPNLDWQPEGTEIPPPLPA